MVKRHMNKHIKNESHDLVDSNIESSLGNQNWHLGNTESEARLSEFEFILWRLIYSFKKWQEDCQSCVSDDDVNADEIALIHLIRMRERPKTIYEISRLMNRDDMPNLQYSLSKLLRLGIIKKSKQDSKRSVFYEITDKGIKITDKYAEMRREILIKKFKIDDQKWSQIYQVLFEYMNIYNEASYNAALSKTNKIK